MNKEQLMVAALENGSVIDHIPTDKLFTVAKLLELDKLTEPVLIGNNLESHMMTRKGLIKVANKFLNEKEISKLAVICPNIRLTVIKNYEVVEKREVNLPETLTDIVKCPNPVCITNNEPMKTVFYVDRHNYIHHLLAHEHAINEDDNAKLKCRYCGKEVNLYDIKLK
ncbi:MAG: aspartate carbamoyltransferase regulatory subunit [Prevotellaceae bacterium]|nr:aspartate carbamoyltransferase regulatory subunit [Candidatus Minthosoma equi]